jgi:hypothetical protein
LCASLTHAHIAPPPQQFARFVDLRAVHKPDGLGHRAAEVVRASKQVKDVIVQGRKDTGWKLVKYGELVTEKAAATRKKNKAAKEKASDGGAAAAAAPKAKQPRVPRRAAVRIAHAARSGRARSAKPAAAPNDDEEYGDITESESDGEAVEYDDDEEEEGAWRARGRTHPRAQSRTRSANGAQRRRRLLLVLAARRSGRACAAAARRTRQEAAGRRVRLLHV